MAKPRSNTARTLARAWGLDVKHALYRKTGDWYHHLEKFPGALMDERGYVIFQTEEAYRTCPELKLKQDVGVPTGISSIPGYTLGDGNSSAEKLTYEEMAFLEGERRDVVQSHVERDRAARVRCIGAYGTSCFVCGFSFERVYGRVGVGFIHVHHLSPVSLGVREVDPVEDMRPLCPNCHAMVHRENPPLSCETLKNMIADKAYNE